LAKCYEAYYGTKTQTVKMKIYTQRVRIRKVLGIFYTIWYHSLTIHDNWDNSRSWFIFYLLRARTCSYSIILTFMIIIYSRYRARVWLKYWMTSSQPCTCYISLVWNKTWLRKIKSGKPKAKLIKLKQRILVWKRNWLKIARLPMSNFFKLYLLLNINSICIFLVVELLDTILNVTSSLMRTQNTLTAVQKLFAQTPLNLRVQQKTRRLMSFHQVQLELLWVGGTIQGKSISHLLQRSKASVQKNSVMREVIFKTWSPLQKKIHMIQMMITSWTPENHLLDSFIGTKAFAPWFQNMLLDF